MAIAKVLDDKDFQSLDYNPIDTMQPKTSFSEDYEQSFDKSKCYSLEEGLAILHSHEQSRGFANG